MTRHAMQQAIKRSAWLGVLCLAGCAQTMTLIPRDGGAPIPGSLRTAQRTMAVTFEGEAYSGDFVGRYAALLMSPSGKTLRCEFPVASVGMTGVPDASATTNGLCQHSTGRVFDLQLR